MPAGAAASAAESAVAAAEYAVSTDDDAAAAITLALPAGDLWQGLQELALASGQRILVPAGSESLAGLRHPALEGEFTLEAALDRLLAGSGYRWERDARGSLLILPRQRARADLETLRIAAEADAPDANTTPASGTPADSRWERSGPSHVEGDRLTTLPAQDFDDLLRRAPNVSGQGDGLAIRGIERGAAGAATSNVYLDGVPLGTRFIETAALPPLQRVHYLRGPRSLWEGPGAMAGIIRLETPDPAYEPGGELRASAASGDRFDLRAGATGQIGDAGPAVRLHAIEQQHGGSIDNAVTGERGIDRSHQTLVQGRLLWEPDAIEALTVRASVLRLRGDPGSTGIVPPSPGVEFDPFSRLSHEALPRSRRLAADGAAIEVDWRFGAGLLRAYGVSARTELGSATRRPGVILELQLRDEDEDSSEAGLRWEQALSQQWQVQLGVDRSERNVRLSDSLVTAVRDFFPAASDVSVTPDATRLLTTAALSDIGTDGAFAQIEWVGKKTALGAGVRRIREQRSNDRTLESRLSNDCTIRIGTRAPIDCADEFPNSFTRRRTPSRDDVWVPNLRGSWEPDADNRLGFELRRGFVGGGARLDSASGALAPYKPERSDTLDVTWSAEWWSGLLEFDAAVFYNRWIDRHVPVDLAQRESYIIVNAGEAHAYGGEFELEWKPGEDFQAWIGLGLLHTRYDDFEARLPFGTVDLQGKRFPGAPPLTATAGARWNFAPRWQFGLSHWYSRESYSDALNTEAGRRPGYGVLDLNLKREIGGHGVLELFVRNALDKQWLEDVRIAGTQSLPREYFVGAERRVGLAMDWTW
jgi:outer membrane receptor protein involved in Fe transport